MRFALPRPARVRTERARRLLALLWLTCACAAPAARAQIIDRVDVTRDAGSARIDIRFAVQIDYLRHAPPDRGQLVTIFFRLIGGEDAAAATLQESRRAPPNDLVPPFEIVYPGQSVPFGAQRRLEVRFRAPVAYRVQPIDNRTIAVFVPLSAAVRDQAAAESRPPPASRPADASGTTSGARPATQPTPEASPAPVPAPAPSAPPAGAAEASAPPPAIESDAEAQMRAARAALEAGQWDVAALALNRVLNLPPNRSSQEAQELIGLAREKLGEPGKARVEYELYLRLYPDGPGAARVRERLARLPDATTAAPREQAAPPKFTGWGSVSQYYYGGKSKIDNSTTIVTPATDATTIDKQTFSAVDQSQLVQNVDVTGRWREGAFDSRFVFRDAFTWNLMREGTSFNRLSAAYAETRYLPNDATARVGRQLGTSGGVLGRYDGASASMALGRDWRVGLVAGSAVDVPAGTRPVFAGVALDALNLFPQKLPGVGAQLFAIAQKVAGAADRIGLGGEARYFDPARSAYGVFDYDPLYRAVNIASVQGTWRVAEGTALNFLGDYRRTPTLSLTNVAFGEGTSDIGALVAARGVGTVRDEAKALTPISKVYLIGVTQSVSPKWQLGADFRLSSLSGTGATSTTPAAPGTGNVFTYTLQAIGTSLTSWQDILVVDASVLHSPALDGWTAGINYLFTPWPPFTLQPTLRYYRQTDDQGGRLTRIAPGVRLVYRIRDRVSIEGEANFERTRSTSRLVEDLLARPFFYIGWHWDF